MSATRNSQIDRDAGDPARPRWIAILGLILIGLVALWFCLRTMILALYEKEFPLIGKAMTPPSATSQAIIALNRASARNGAADPLAWQLARAALDRGPLLAEPFIVAGLDASTRDDFARARRLMEEARRRDPRAIIARYWLFDDYLRSGDYAAGIAEAEPLIRLQPAAETAAVSVLTALIEVPAARPALSAALATRPRWLAAFYRQATASPQLRDAALRLMDAGMSGRSIASGYTYDRMIDALVTARRWDRAYALWRQTLPASRRPQSPGLYDGGFTGEVGGPPFGWRLAATGGTVAIVPATDASSRSGLAIRTDGNRSRVVAEQLVLVPPGAIRLTFSTRTLEDATSAAGLRLELRCGTRGKALAQVTVEDFTPRLIAHVVAAQVPARCGTVGVRASVIPGLETGPVNVLLTDMVLRRE